jgi:DtxR family transcriptional regulator, Mn-dependent transcriptional regulator
MYKESALSSQMEDYLETIFHLCLEEGVARVKTIAEYLDVSTPSVVGAMKNLKRRDLVRQEPYGFVRLTEKGETVAKTVVDRHRVLADFLEDVLGLDPETASLDACRIEHAASPETINRLRAMGKFIENEPKTESCWAEAFKRFYKGNVDKNEDDKDS